MNTKQSIFIANESIFQGARERAQQLRALADFAENWSSVPRICMATHNGLQLGDSMPSSGLSVYCTYMVHRHAVKTSIQIK